MKRIGFTFLFGIVLLAGCGGKEGPTQGKHPSGEVAPAPSMRSGGNAVQPQVPTSPAPLNNQPNKAVSLAEARRGVTTRITRRASAGEPVPEPPPDIFQTIRYSAPPGQLAAYLTLDPKDGKKHPAIIWITGGDCNAIGWGEWEDAPENNDQTAGAYRKAGIIMMFPSLRGGNDNPGVKEGFFGEVEDVLAAAEYLAKQDFVDPNRIYLGGHSTGGTLVLLVAECSDRFRAVFSFGPVGDIALYGAEYLPFNINMMPWREIRLRSPIHWLHSIRSPVFVFEGIEGNITDLRALTEASPSPKVRFFAVEGADHFTILAPTNRLIADKVRRDDGPTSNLTFTEQQLNELFAD